MNRDDLLKELRKRADPAIVAGKARYGITPQYAGSGLAGSGLAGSGETLGIRIPDLLSMAKKIGTDHDLAVDIWSFRIHEARILACMIADPEKVSERLMEQWVGDFDSWDLCDQCCNRLFRKTDLAWEKMVEWTQRDEEYVKRAGFVLMAVRAVHDKTAPDGSFEALFPVICREASDDRNFVKKSVNWALRQIGKRNLALNKKAVATCEKIVKIDSKTARWIAGDARRELTGETVLKRLTAATPLMNWVGCHLIKKKSGI